MEPSKPPDSESRATGRAITAWPRDRVILPFPVGRTLLSASPEGEPTTVAGCLIRSRHVRQVLHQGADGVLRIVDAQVAVLVRGVEGAQQRRPVPVGEMLGVG